MALTENFGAFLADFGVDGTLDGAPVLGIYDAPGATTGSADFAAATLDPQYQLPTASVPTAPVGKTLVIPAGTFKVREHVPDGTGMSLLVLTGPLA